MARKSLTPDQIDDLGKGVLHLARELWVVKDRQRILERILTEKGIDVENIIDTYQPDDALEKHLAEERDAFAQSFLAKLAPDDSRQ